MLKSIRGRDLPMKLLLNLRSAFDDIDFRLRLSINIIKLYISSERIIKKYVKLNIDILPHHLNRKFRRNEGDDYGNLYRNACVVNERTSHRAIGEKGIDFQILGNGLKCCIEL